MATNRDNWQYNSIFTVRVEKVTKDILLEAAKYRGVPFSEHVRDILERAILPNDLCDLLSDQYRERIEKQARKVGKEPGEVLLDVIRHGVPYALDNMVFGF